MSDLATPGGRPGSRFALAALGLGSFVVGTAELVVVGVLNLIADDLEVSAGTAGLLVTAYALGIAVGGPLLTALTMRLSRRTVLLLALTVFVAGNVVAVLSGVFGLLFAARALCGALHGLFVGAATSVATGLVPADRRGQAVSLVFGGISVATVLGVPVGTLVGQSLGWQVTFLCVIGLGVLALATVVLTVPRASGPSTENLSAQARHAFAPRVLAMLAAYLLLMGSQFVAFTYLTPYVEDVTGIPAGAVSAFLLIFGVCSAVGTFGGGRFADRNASRTLLIGNLVLIAALGALYVFGDNAVLAGLILAVWGLVGFGVTPSLQLRVISLAGEGRDLAATLGASAANAGIALGAALGGWALSAHGADDVPLVAMIALVVALPVVWATRFLTVPPPAGSAARTPPQEPERAHPSGGLIGTTR
ncbi:MFS transporter [Streptomyces sp. NPDC049813]|uniref:MFS transporter n=1 Tax=Streptomyces sp. NPDC049813 TaxID=3365597 RepID=UPI0037910714